MSMKKDYNHLCGLDFSDHPAGSSGGEGGGWGASLGAAGGATSSSSSSSEGLPPLAPPAASTAANRLLFGRVGVMNFTVAALYFCNQRPGIFVAPYLLLQEIPESQIGFVLFVSGVVALILQTPAGQLVDEVHNKNRILIAGYLATAFGCLLLSNVVDIAVVTLAVTINVVSDVFVFPSLYATTLGLFGSDGIDQQAPLNETGTHSGNAVFATLAGAIVVLGVAGPSSIFYICVAMRGVGIAIILCFINYYDIDFKRSRGLVDVVTVETSDLEASSHSKSSLASITLLAPEEPLSYRALLTDFHVIIFLVSVMLFHFSNAAMLPLLSQHLFINNSDQGVNSYLMVSVVIFFVTLIFYTAFIFPGFAFAAAAVITAQVSMVASASMAGRLVPRIGTKPLFISALLAIPLRGVFIVLLLQSELAFKNSFLLATQILDGLAGGIFGVLLVLITENLSRYFNVKN